MYTLCEKIKNIEKKDENTIVSLKSEYGIFWTGKAKYVFSAVTYEAWKSTNIDVIIIKPIIK